MNVAHSTAPRANHLASEDVPAILFPLIAVSVTLTLMDAPGIYWLIGLVVAGMFGGLWFLAQNHVRRWEERVNSAVERYVRAYEECSAKDKPSHALQMLFDAVGLTLRNNFELSAVRRRIRKRGLADPASSSEYLMRVNLHKFFKFVRRENLRLDGPAGKVPVILRYKGLSK